MTLLDEEELAHLHALCSHCRDRFPAVTELQSRRAAEDEAAAAARPHLERRAFEMRLEADRRQAEVEIEEFLDLDRGERAKTVRRARTRYRTPAFVDRMIEEGEARSGDNALLIAFGAGLTYAAQVITVP